MPKCSIARKFNFLIYTCPFPQFLYMHGVTNCILIANETNEVDILTLYSQFARDKRVNLVCIGCDKPYILENPIHYHFMLKTEAKNEITQIPEGTYVIDFEAYKPEVEQAFLTHNASYIRLTDEFIGYYISYAAFIQPFLYYCDIHPNVPVIVYERPTYPPPGSRTDFEQYLVEKNFSKEVVYRELIHGNETKLPDILGYTLKETALAFLGNSSFLDTNGIRRFNDLSVGRINYKNGYRVTTDTPALYERTCYIVGACPGTMMVIDEHTTASCLQRLFNEKGLKIRVCNYHICAEGHDEDITKLLFSLPVKPNDIIILEKNLEATPIHPLYSDISLQTRLLFSTPHKYGEVFYTYEGSGHYNANGHRELADVLYEHLSANNFFNNMTNRDIYKNTLKSFTYNMPYNLPAVINTELNTEPELAAYKRELKKARVITGAIVMNCNPFTLGHRYLIEESARRCAYLYIFVVEEDKSFFPFEDRFNLVKQGVLDIPNVTVLPSGKFIISSITFADYFNKQEIQDKTVDTSKDLELFAKHIAPTLGINVRFAGEEPFDAITRQYNESMREILPAYDIDFIEIKRKESDGTPISASYVRKLLEDKDFETIAKIVPATTLEYLKTKFLT